MYQYPSHGTVVPLDRIGSRYADTILGVRVMLNQIVHRVDVDIVTGHGLPPDQSVEGAGPLRQRPQADSDVRHVERGDRCATIGPVQRDPPVRAYRPGNFPESHAKYSLGLFGEAFSVGDSVRRSCSPVVSGRNI